MKKYIKGILPAFIVSFVSSFMFYINEPIMMLAGNVNDFWFDLSFLMKFSFIPFIILFVVSFLIFTILYFINKKLFNISYIIYFILFIVFYIQGNYLVGSLPVLDGTPIVWDGFKIDVIISIVLFVVVVISSIFLLIKFKFNNYIKYSSYLTLAIFAMLGTSLITTLLTTDGLDSK